MKDLKFKFGVKDALSVGSLVLGVATLLVNKKIQSDELKDLKAEVTKEILDNMSNGKN